ncbi:ABC-type transport auxiliary lipoprotein family protein [Kaistia dalseonensis]|uniref:Cholesterol transport system auxiliary component n=1 Tax=Kaistia dalseonensis TaxID=410840 RepID=A0ABU0H1C2_9HYPH|nr:ABC-type transport auxiliary lipoprotein family protein [Kaistia dalseonensis]MCX5493553.1 ABC-type transport auxiliary lipoprotein family protein [Kaistia dalseonensis]MDQ0436113.1 cholesterol transport system auxiliary component [Kaistia dalseonensis]
MRLVKRTARGAALASILCAALLSGCVSKLLTTPPPNTYELTGPTELPQAQNHTTAQLLVPAPTALKILDSQRVAVSRGSLVAYYPNAQYADTLPRVIQARVIETFEKAKQAKAVGRPGEGLSIDYQLLTDIRSFNFNVGANSRTAVVEISARIMNDRNGRVVAFKVFRAEVPVAEDTAPAAVAGLNAALDQVLVELVSWSLGKI